MDIHEKNRIIYQTAVDYLWKNSDGLTQEILDAYLENQRKSTMNEVFRIAVFSFHDWNYRTKAGIKENEREISELFRDFSLTYFRNNISVLPDYEKDLLFKKAFGGSDNACKKVKENILTVAEYLAVFGESVEKMYIYFDSFDSDQKNREKLMKEISGKVKWWGKILAANFLKDIGMSNYSKPDEHVSAIISDLGLADNNISAIMNAVLMMSEDCKAIDDSVTPFKIDRILYIIGSKNHFWNHKGIFKGSQEDFIESVNKKLID